MAQGGDPIHDGLRGLRNRRPGLKDEYVIYEHGVYAMTARTCKADYPPRDRESERATFSKRWMDVRKREITQLHMLADNG